MGRRRHKAELERKHGRPIKQLLAEAINRCGSISAAARELGVPISTANTWVLRYRLRTRRIAEVEEEGLSVPARVP
jgi:molybdenum-dependent DNA-binding transcriptional regulator ModE